MTAPSVLLLAMPFASVELPNLSVALLQGHFQRAGYRCDAHYANLELAARLDPDIRQLASGGPLAGEWLFVPALYGQPITDDDVERFQEFARGVLGPAFTDDLGTRLPQTVVAMITSNMSRAGHPSRVEVMQSSPQGKQMGLLTDSLMMTDNLATVLDMEIDQPLETRVIDPIIAIEWRHESDQAALEHKCISPQIRRRCYCSCSVLARTVGNQAIPL